MKIEEYTPISPDRLKWIRWRGERFYRVLSHSFSIRWNRAMSPDRFDYVWGGFQVGRHDGWGETLPPDGAPVYSLIDLGPQRHGRFRLLVDGREVAICGNPDELVDHLLWHVFERMPQENDRYLLFHAGSVATPRGEGVLLPAESGFGKTTLVVALIRAGFGFLSDETGVLDHHDGVLRPHPRALNLKEGSATLFPDLWPPRRSSPGASDGYLRADEIRLGAVSGPCPIRYVIFPRYHRAAETQVFPLGPAEAVERLWGHGTNLPAYGHRALPLLAELVRQVRSHAIVSGDLEGAVRAVQGLTGSTAP